MTFLKGENVDDTFLIFQKFQRFLKKKLLPYYIDQLIQNFNINNVLTELHFSVFGYKPFCLILR